MQRFGTSISRACRFLDVRSPGAAAGIRNQLTNRYGFRSLVSGRLRQIYSEIILDFVWCRKVHGKGIYLKSCGKPPENQAFFVIPVDNRYEIE
ncbi:MAG: hypothetical protein ACOYBD_06610 [Bilifractor sp.]